MITTKEYNTQLEVLQDLKKNGKPRPWREHKLKSLELSKSYNRLSKEKRSIQYYNYTEDVYACANYLKFNADTGKFVEAYFCQKRLCSMCNWRKSLKVFWAVSNVMDAIIKDNPNIQPVFLTLTQKNCDLDKLDEEIKKIFDGFKRLTDNRIIREQVLGWFRALEVTYSKNHNNWHPHIHIVLLFDKSYFAKTNKRYINQEEWVRLWGMSMRLDYLPNVDIRKLRGKNGNTRKGIAEVAKYTLKTKQILTKDIKLTDKLVDYLTQALYKKRLYAYGGLMAKVAKQLKLDKPDEGDLVKIDETIRGDIVEFIKVFKFDFGLMDYIRKR